MILEVEIIGYFSTANLKSDLTLIGNMCVPGYKSTALCHMISRRDESAIFLSWMCERTKEAPGR